MTNKLSISIKNDYKFNSKAQFLILCRMALELASVTDNGMEVVIEYNGKKRQLEIPAELTKLAHGDCTLEDFMNS